MYLSMPWDNNPHWLSHFQWGSRSPSRNTLCDQKHHKNHDPSASFYLVWKATKQFCLDVRHKWTLHLMQAACVILLQPSLLQCRRSILIDGWWYSPSKWTSLTGAQTVAARFFGSECAELSCGRPRFSDLGTTAALCTRLQQCWPWIHVVSQSWWHLGHPQQNVVDTGAKHRWQSCTHVQQMKKETVVPLLGSQFVVVQTN